MNGDHSDMAKLARPDLRLADDLVVVLIIRDGAVLYLRAGKRKEFPDFKIAHGGAEPAMLGHVRSYLRDELGLPASFIERIGHIQKDPRDIMQYFINAHIYIYRAVLPPDQPAALSPDGFRFGWHDPRSGQQEGFSYKARLMLDFLRDWTPGDFQRLDAREIRDWYNAWLARHLQDAYREFVDQDIESCRAEDERFAREVGAIAGTSPPRDGLDGEIDGVFEESQRLADLIARTADEIGAGQAQPETGGAAPDPALQISALETVKRHLCGRLFGLKQSHVNEAEQRIARKLIGRLLKRANGLLDKYRAEGAAPGFDQELKVLLFDLESESLSPFERRRG